MSHVAAAERYARAVVKGEILACKWTLLACRRHLGDLGREGDPDFPYRFGAEAAERVCDFLELLPHTKGRWAAGTPGQAGSNRIHLEAWQTFILCVLFGWLRTEGGTRRFRIAYICVPRKNGKSILAAGIGLYLLAADGEYGAEVYSGATTEKQAWEVFRPAKLMVERTADFRAAFGVDVHAKNLHILENGSRFEPVIGKPGDGASPSCAIVDEYHEHQTDELYDTMLTGMGAREQPLMLVITTAGSDTAGPCYHLQSEVQKVLEGALRDEELFGIVYTIDEGDSWTSEPALRKANPNYGVSIGADYLKSRVAEAERSSRKQNIVRTKHLNVWVGARSAWMNLEAWKRCADPTLREADFAGERCWAGMDLASKVDIAATMKVFRREIGGEPHFYVFGRYYLPEEIADQPEKQHYQGWVHDGHLIATPGNIIDHGAIGDDLAGDASVFQLAELAYDPWGATQLALHLQEEHEITVIEVPQRTSHLSEPMKWLEALVLAGRVHHDDDPVLHWMMSNVVAKMDANENIFPRKERPENKIDGVVALIMALGRALLEGGAESSIYEDRGLLVF